MKFLLDECAPALIGNLLMDAGHIVDTIRSGFVGIQDDEVLARSVENNAILITEDKDFGELVRRYGRPTIGVVLLRLWSLPAPARAASVVALVHAHGDELPGSFTVITLTNVRIRRLNAPFP